MAPTECPGTIPYVIPCYCHTAMIISFFTKFLHCFGLIIFKSGNVTETFVKGLAGGGGGGGVFCISKAFVYILLPLELRASDKIHETERTRNCIIYLCYQIYFVGSAVPKNSNRGTDCNPSLLDTAVHLHGCLFIYIKQGCQWKSQKWPFLGHWLI